MPRGRVINERELLAQRLVREAMADQLGGDAYWQKLTISKIGEKDIKLVIQSTDPILERPSQVTEITAVCTIYEERGNLRCFSMILDWGDFTQKFHFREYTVQGRIVHIRHLSTTTVKSVTPSSFAAAYPFGTSERVS